MTTDSEAIATARATLGKGAVVDAPLGARTTYRVGGTAAIGFTAQDETDLRRVAEAKAATGLAVLIVGLGSNMLVADTGFDGIAVHLGERFAEIDWPDADLPDSDLPDADQPSAESANYSPVKAGAAVPLPVLARQCAARSLGGLGWAVGVPGSVGGAVRMNAGGHGSDIASCLLSATVFDLATAQQSRHNAAQLQLGYRSSCIQPSQVVTSASFACYEQDAQQAQRELKEIAAWRRQNQPGGQNAGSIFKNPAPDSQAPDSQAPDNAPSAGALIDQLGLKGLRVGGAHVSEVHANFIVADTDATASDVAKLIDLVAQRVQESSGVTLNAEVRFVGFDDR